MEIMGDGSKENAFSQLKPVIHHKSAKLLQARSLESIGRIDEANELYAQVANDEQKIAKELLINGQNSEAAVNLISAASCLSKLSDFESAINLLNEILAMQDVQDSLKKEVAFIRQNWLKKLSEKKITGKSEDQESSKDLYGGGWHSSSSPSDCSHDDDCPSGFRCVSGVCVPMF
jgi:tetratricopeptide (TPR) repeat protein